MKKGVGTTIEAILEILIILFFLMILLALLSKTTEKNVKLNTASLEISKLSNTFYLLNRSLYTTWYVSTVQTLFTSSFEGMGCTDKYWYKTDPAKSFIGDRAARFPIIFPSVSTSPIIIETYVPNYAEDTRYERLSCNIDNAIASGDCTEVASGSTEKVKISGNYPEGEHEVFSCKVDKFTDNQCSDLVAGGIEVIINKKFIIASHTEQDPERKYTVLNPAVCAPNNGIASYLLNLSFSFYKNIERDVRANGINIHVGSKDLTAENTDIISGFSIAHGSVTGNVSHEIHMTAPTSSIDSSFEHKIRIETNISDMMQNAMEAVGFLMSMHDKMNKDDTLTDGNGNLVYKDELYDPRLLYVPASSDAEGNILFQGDDKQAYEDRIWDMLGDMPEKDNVDIDVDNNIFEFEAMPGGRGLFLHYNADITFLDKSLVSRRELLFEFQRNDASVLGWPWPTESRRITSCFGETRGSESGVRVHRGIDIGAGSSDDILVPGLGQDTIKVIRAVSGCLEGDESCGGGYGNLVELEHQGNGYVYRSMYTHLDTISVSEGDEFPLYESNKMVLGTMGNTGRSTGKHLHFEVSKDGTKLNPCDFMDCSESSTLECSVGEGGVLTEEVHDSGYYFYDEQENRFFKIPMQLHIKTEDYLPAIDCATDNLYTYEKNIDIACSGGKLYTCGAANNIKGLGPEQKVGEDGRIENLLCRDLEFNLITEG